MRPRFAASSGPAAATIATSAGDITFGPSSSLVALASQDGLTGLVYNRVAPSVDLSYEVMPASVKETIVLANAQGGSSWTFDYRAPGMSAVKTADGSVVFKNSAGAIVAVIPEGAAWDSAATPAAVPAKLALIGNGPNVKVRVSVDPAWLSSPARVWPVHVDPSMTATQGASTAYKSDGTSCTNPTCKIRIGNSQSGVGGTDTFWRSTVHFGYESLFGKHILGATINESVIAGTNNCYNHVWYRVTSESYNGYTQNLTNNPTNLCGPSGSATGPGLVSHLQSLATGSISGARLFARGQESALTYTYKELNATLSVTYNSYPGEPRGRSVTPNFSTSPLVTRSLTPKLTANTNDADGGTLRYQFQVFAGHNPANTGTPVADSGLIATSVPQGTEKAWNVPTGKLVDGGLYAYRVRAYDGTDYGAWSDATGGWANFTVDVTKPVTPTVTSSTHPSGGWVPATSATFTFGNAGSTDVLGYLWSLDNGASTYQTGTSLTLPSVTPGQHHLRVQAKDRGGNVSPIFTYPFNVGIGAVTSPVEGDRTQMTVNLTAAAQSGFTTARFQYRRADTDSWTDIPLSALKTPAGNPVTTLDQPLSSGVTSPIVWDVTATSGIGTVDGPVQVQAVLAPGSGTVATASRFTLDQAGTGVANAAMGPGSVNLLTGNFTLDSTDVSVDAYLTDLTVSRTFNSRAASAGSNGIFGPGWTSSVGVESADSDYTGLTVTGSLVSVQLPGGGSVGFTQKTGGGGYTPEVGAEDLTLTSTGAPITKYTLADLDGNQTDFTNETGSWLPTAVRTVGTDQATTKTSWEVVNNVTRPTRLLAPAPAGVSCTATDPAQLAKGCRALTFTYAAASTPAPAPGTYGDFAGRLSKISFWAWTGTAVTSTDVSSYAYDSTGRLAHSWDPRISPALKTAYAYDSNGLITTLTPPGLTAWTMTYDSTVTGKLLTARQVQPNAGGTAVTTVLYDIPLSGTGAPHDLSATARASWGQSAAPFFATAIVPPISSGTAATTADLNKATVHYLDASGREINSATPGGRISTTEYDSWGNIVRSLSPANRQRALAESGAVEQAAMSRLLDTQNIYSADGTLLLETYGPEHDTIVGGAKVRARAHTVNTYDEGAPSTGGPYRLVTTSKTGARIAGAITDSEVRTSKTGYDWTLRQPTSSTTDPDGLNLISRTSYDAATGLVTSSTLPGSAVNTTAQTTVTTYYTAAANASFPTCGGHAEWAGLVCRTGPGGQPATGPAIPATYTTYNVWNAPLQVTQQIDSPLSVLRTTTMTYDAAGRSLTTAISAAASTASVAVPTTTNVYNATTGQLDKVTFTDAGGQLREVVHGYDPLGRQVSYKDADSNSAPAATTFDLQGRPIQTADGAGTQTRSYDPVTGELTQLVDSGAGTFTTTYTGGGELATVTYPGGVKQTITTDETGTTTDLEYELTSNCPAQGCLLVADHAVENIFGQQIDHAGTQSSQTYGYDAAGRLTSVKDQVGTVCTTRAYFFDPAAANGAGKDSNRTGEASSTGAANAACPTVSAPTTTHSYDTASRISNTGYAYDALGRTTTVPGAGTLNGVAQSPTYYANDLVASLGTTSYTLDPTSDRFRQIATPAGVVTRHYADGGDSPTWSTAPGGTSVAARNVSGPTGDLAAIITGSAVSLQLANLHGDVFATIIPGAQSPSAVFESTEFGIPRASGDIGTRKYGWLGAKTREADNAGGLILMGVRLYNPKSGRFLSVDPVHGGSANAYDYGYSDPVNVTDLDGRCPFCAVALAVGARAAFAYGAKKTGQYLAKRAVSSAAKRAIKQWGQKGFETLSRNELKWLQNKRMEGLARGHEIHNRTAKILSRAGVRYNRSRYPDYRFGKGLGVELKTITRHGKTTAKVFV